MDLERIERTGDRETRLREYRKRGLLIERGLPLVHETCDAMLLSNARRWLRVMEDERPAREHIAPLSSAILRTTGDGQEHSRCPGSHRVVVERTHALMLWFDLYMNACSLVPRPFDWRPPMRSLLPSRHDSMKIGYAYWAYYRYTWRCLRVVLGDITRPCFDGIEDTGVTIETGRVSSNGLVNAGSWCPPLPAFDADLKPLTQEGAS